MSGKVMSGRAIAVLSTRAAFHAVAVLTSLLCLTAYLPFTFNTVHKSELFPALEWFKRMHPWITAAVTAAVLAETAPCLRAVRGSDRWLRTGWAASACLWALLLAVRPVFAGIGHDFAAFLWGLPPLAAAATLSLIDLRERGREIPWGSASNTGAIFCTAIAAAALVPALQAPVAWMRQGGGLDQLARGYAWSLPSHAVIFLGVFVLMHWGSTAACCTRRPGLAEFAICHALAAAALVAALLTIAFRPLGFDGWMALVQAGLIAAALTAFHASAAVWLVRDSGARSGYETAFTPACLGAPVTPLAAVTGLAVTAVVSGALLTRAAAMDWNYLAQKLAAAFVWMSTFGLLFSALHRRASFTAKWGVFLFASIAILGGYRKLQARLVPSAEAMDRYAGYDASFLLARDILAQAPAEAGIYQVMARNTNLPKSVEVAPVAIDLVSKLEPSGGPRPDIFLITIDSLRRDYLSPYDASAGFTPEIAAFARESVVFRNAFTRYGGTALAEPSIWAGGLMLHKQYVTPFAPMNNLEKLLRAENYRMMVSRDSILEAILGQDDPANDLDHGSPDMHFDLCTSLGELAGRLGRSGEGPVFAYTQPQNLHISEIQRQGNRPVDGADYGAHFAPYASRVARLDACFGKFVRELKRLGRLESSIIVLTADHGDSLGEDGRWGHAYTIFPEILRIPLIVRLPESLRERFAADPASLAFSSDITPSLYALLGHGPIEPLESGGVRFNGEALFTEGPAHQGRDRREWHMVASSYAAVYGMLRGDGGQLYIADGVNFKEHSFDLTQARPVPAPLSEPARAAHQERLRNAIEAVNRVYRFAGRERKPVIGNQ